MTSYLTKAQGEIFELCEQMLLLLSRRYSRGEKLHDIEQKVLVDIQVALESGWQRSLFTDPQFERHLRSLADDLESITGRKFNFTISGDTQANTTLQPPEEGPKEVAQPAKTWSDRAPRVVPLTEHNLWSLRGTGSNKPFTLVDRIKTWQGGKYGTIAAERCFRMHSIRSTGLDQGMPDAVQGNRQLCRVCRMSQTDRFCHDWNKKCKFDLVFNYPDHTDITLKLVREHKKRIHDDLYKAPKPKRRSHNFWLKCMERQAKGNGSGQGEGQGQGEAGADPADVTTSGKGKGKGRGRGKGKAKGKQPAATGAGKAVSSNARTKRGPSHGDRDEEPLRKRTRTASRAASKA